MRSRLTLLALLLALFATGCPEPGQAGGEGSAGDEDVTFPDEAEAQAPPRHPASDEVARGEEALVAGDVGAALEHFESAIAANAADPRAHFDLALVLELRNQYDGAAEHYRAALELDPGFPEALNNYGLLLRDSGDAGEAVPILERAIEAQPGNGEAHLNLAMALEELGQERRALEHYRRAARLSEGDAFARANLGLLLLKMGEEEQARLELRRALQVARGDAAVLQAVGNGLRRVGDHEGAVRAMQMAVEAHEDGPTPALLSELALAQRAAGDREAAEASLRRALALDERYAIGHYLLGGVLAGRGEYREAIRHYERYLALEPNGEQAERARQNIAAARAAR